MIAMDLNNELRLRDAEWMASDAARPALRKAATRSPVFWYENEGDGFWVVLQHADIVEISRRAVEFSTSRGIMLADQPGSTKGVLLWTDPPEHRRLRRYVHDFFSPRASTRLAPWIRKRCIELVGRARGRDMVDMIGEVAADLPLMTISKMMGVPEAEQSRFLRLANRIFDEAGNSPEAYQESMEDLPHSASNWPRPNTARNSSTRCAASRIMANRCAMRSSAQCSCRSPAPQSRRPER